MPESAAAIDPLHANRTAENRTAELTRLFLIALGFTTLDLLWLIKPAAEPTQRVAYHWSGNLSGLYLSVFADVMILTLALMLLLLIARKPGRARVAVWAGLILFLPWVCYMDSRLLLDSPIYRPPGLLLFWGATFLTACITALWKPAYAPRLEQFLSPVASVVVFCGIFGLFLCLRLAWNGWEAHSWNSRYASQHAPVVSVSLPHRVIWVVFDELSYQQLYEHRFQGLQMPAFDALAKQATVFTQVVPVDIQTEVAVPGLISGESADDMRTTPTGHFSLHQTSGQWKPFDPRDTVFQDALNDGYSTGIAGWYNPYCHILAEQLNHCSWVFHGAMSNGMTSSETVLHNMAGPLNVLIKMLGAAAPVKLQRALTGYRLPASGTTENEFHITDLTEISAAGMSLARDPRVGFVLIHLPIPHPAGLYDRASGALRPTGSYIDNLAISDKYLAQLRSVLEQTGQWDSSTVVVMGDHSWRTQQIWYRLRRIDGWTNEDNTASDGGGYDQRPAYIVKLPGQQTAARFDATYRAQNTRALFDAILSNKIKSSADLSAWASTVR